MLEFPNICVPNLLIFWQRLHWAFNKYQLFLWVRDHGVTLLSLHFLLPNTSLFPSQLRPFFLLLSQQNIASAYQFSVCSFHSYEIIYVQFLPLKGCHLPEILREVLLIDFTSLPLLSTWSIFLYFRKHLFIDTLSLLVMELEALPLLNRLCILVRDWQAWRVWVGV